MADDNLSAVLYGKFDLRMEEFPSPEPKEGEVQIAVHSTGICGSDVSYFTKGYIGDFVVKDPMVLGHESAGTVCKLGPGVTNLEVGDRVAMEPGVPCRRCEYCKGGRYNLCPDVTFYATPPYQLGTLTRKTILAADFCFKLPDHVSMEEGALLEPLSVGVHACKRANVSIGKKVLVCGAGPIGLVSMLSAKAMGANAVCVTDISQSRLDFAKKLGADHVILADTKDGQEMAVRVKDAMGGMPEITIECSGAESAIQLAIYATKSGGVVVLVGLGPPTVTIPVVNAAVREVDIRGVFRYCNSYQDALDMIATGRVDVKPLVTNRFTLEETPDAYKAAMAGTGIKIMIKSARD